MEIHHVGYAVKNMDKAITEFLNLGYSLKGDTVEDTYRNVLIQFIENKGYLIELICKNNSEEYSPVDDILKKNKGAIPYHLCYETDNISLKINELCDKKYILIESEKEAVAIEYRKVAFLYNKDIGIIELVQKEI